MQPEQLIDERTKISNSDHTFFEGFLVDNRQLKLLADYASYRKGGVKCGRPLNVLEAFAMDVLERHAEQLEFEKMMRGFRW